MPESIPETLGVELAAGYSHLAYIIAFAGSGVLAIIGAATVRVRIRAVGELSGGDPFGGGLG